MRKYKKKTLYQYQFAILDAATLAKLQQRVQACRHELASINRKVSSISRLIEQVPNRVELREYRLRFTELYNQGELFILMGISSSFHPCIFISFTNIFHIVNKTYKETKGYFNVYNSLEDTKCYMDKELNLLNSIVDSYSMYAA